MNKEGQPNLEYNLVGGLFLTVREQDFRNLIEGVISAGYNHACVLPFRALTKRNAIENLKNSSLSIIHLEEAWNPTPYDFLPKAVLAGLWGFFQRQRNKQIRPPTIADALFPGKATCETLLKTLMETCPQAKLVSHQVNLTIPKERLLLEISEGLNLSASEILEISQRDEIGLVFDPSHLLSSERMISLVGQPTRKPQGEWEKQLLAFAQRVEVVDINLPRRGDIHLPEENAINNLLQGKGILAELAAAAKELPGVRFLRVEIPVPLSAQIPFSPKQKEGFQLLKAIGEVLKSA